MSRAVSNQSEHNASQIKLPQGGVQQCKRKNRATIHRHAGKNDAARAEAINPAAQERGDDTQSNGGEPETERNLFAVPTECRAQWFHKDVEGVDKERTESGHYAKTCRQNHAPAVVAEIEFRPFDRRFGDWGVILRDRLHQRSAHTRRAVSATSFSLAHWRSSVRRFPSAVEAKPHCGLSAKSSMGT